MEPADLIKKLCQHHLYVPLLAFLIVEHILLLLSAVFIYYTATRRASRDLDSPPKNTYRESLNIYRANSRDSMLF